MMLLMVVIGACLGQFVSLLLAMVSDFQTATSYGMLVSYPVMFLPPMWYASFQSRKNQFFDTGYALDSNHFGNLKGWGAASSATLWSPHCLRCLNSGKPHSRPCSKDRFG